MSGKRWLLLCAGALALVLILWAGLNLLVDPFGTFGTFRWDSYSQTLNPRNSKAIEIEARLDEFDGYIIGSSSAASYDPGTLGNYLDASFYNLFHYGADISYDKQLVEYLLEQDKDVKYIFLVLGLTEAGIPGDRDSLTDRSYYKVSGESPLTYYSRFLFASPSYAVEKLSSYRQDTLLPQSFDVFLPETGCYDKQIRDVESIGSMESYLEKNSVDFPEPQTQRDLADIDHCAETVAEIRSLCEEAGTELIVVLSPVCQTQLEGYTLDSVNAYFSVLSQVTDYWNFAISPITYDLRYFYDATHPRNDTGNMVLSCMFDDQTPYPDLGVFCSSGESVSAEAMREKAQQSESAETAVPILLYHHLSETEAESDTVLSPARFAHQMELLEENGYTPVTFSDLIDYVERGTALPDRPVVITFDDGYFSNYEYAFPILQKHGFPATIFVIGCSVGHDQYYKDTSYEMTPHFGPSEIQKMCSSGLITIASHTYDMHQWSAFEEGESIRPTILPLAQESEQDYVDALTEDVSRQNTLFESIGLESPSVLAFPAGKHTTLTDVTLQKCGIQVTVTTDQTRVNTLVRGLRQSLLSLGRMNISGDTTDEALLAYLETQESLK